MTKYVVMDTLTNKRVSVYTDIEHALEKCFELNANLTENEMDAFTSTSGRDVTPDRYYIAKTKK